MICCSVQWLRKLKSTSCGDFVMLFLLKNYNNKFHARINVIAQRQKCNKKIEGIKVSKLKMIAAIANNFVAVARQE